MAEYIERETAIMTAMNYDGNGTAQDSSQDIAAALGCIPAADVAPVVRGRWIKLDVHNGMEQHKCSVCNQECYVPTCMGEPLYSYCPNCGADMREAPNDP